MELDDCIEIYILDHEKCGKCNNIYYISSGSCPFSCSDVMPLPRYVNRNFMANCQNFSKRTRTSVIVPLDVDIKELESFYKVSKR